MKIMIPVLIAASLCGCVLRTQGSGGLHAADGLSSGFPADADRLGREVADELARRYAPARTELVLITSPGQFAESLEAQVRSQGFAVSADSPSAVRVGTVADVLQGEQTPSGYVAVTTSDGQRFSLVRRLYGGPAPVPGATQDGAVVAEPFAIPEPPTTVRSTPLSAGTPTAPAAGPATAPADPAPYAVEKTGLKAWLTPEESSKPLVAQAAVSPSSPASSSASVSAPVPSAQASVPAPSGPVLVLPKGILKVLPYDWRYTIPDADKRQARVHTPENAPWREAIQSMAAESGCRADFDETARRVTLQATPAAPTPVVQTEPVAPVSALHPASLPEVPSSQPVAAPVSTPAAASPAESPVVKAALTNVTSSTSVAVSPASASSPHPTPPEATGAGASPVAPSVTPPQEPEQPEAVETILPETVWTLEPGSLYAQLGRWAEQAGYQLVWKADTDLTMESRAVFRGSIIDVVGELFTGLNKAGYGLRVTFYQSNTVMEVRGE